MWPTTTEWSVGPEVSVIEAPVVVVVAGGACVVEISCALAAAAPRSTAEPINTECSRRMMVFTFCQFRGG